MIADSENYTATTTYVMPEQMIIGSKDFVDKEPAVYTKPLTVKTGSGSVWGQRIFLAIAIFGAYLLLKKA